MKVYVCTCGEYENYRIEKICSSKEKAEEFQKNFDDIQRQHYINYYNEHNIPIPDWMYYQTYGEVEIEEWEVEKDKEKTGN